MNIILTMSILGIFFYNVPLGLIAGGYFLFRWLIINHQRLLDLFAFVLIIIGAWLKFDCLAVIAQPSVIWQYLQQHGLYALLLYQAYHLSYVYQHGLFFVFILPLMIQILYDWQIKHLPSKKLHRHAELVSASTDSSNTVSLCHADPDFTGVALGYDNQGNPITIADQELNQHCLIIGTTGSGKTTTLLNFVASSAKRGLPLVFLDGKGSVDLIDKMRVIANQYGRTFKVFTLRPRPELENLAGYNPFGSGTPTEWKNRIMSLFAQVEGKGQEHYALGEQNYINFVANVLAKLETPVDLRMILSFLENPEKLLAVAHELAPEMGKKLATLHTNSELRQLIGDVIKFLELFVYSDYGHLFNTTQLDNVIMLSQSILNNEIVLFQFDASAYPEDTRKVAKMVINDLNSSFASFGKFTKCFCIFDEFASYASDNLAETISLHRSNGMHAIIGSQSLTTVKLKASDTKRIAEELVACCNTYIAQTINHFADAEIMARIMGVAKNHEVSTTITSSQDNLSSSQHIKLTDNYRVHPQNILDLHTGEAIIYRKAANLTPVKVKISAVES